MKYKTIDDKQSLIQKPLDWDWTCLYCGIEVKGYYDFYKNFEPELRSNSIVFNVYCKSCRDIFDSFATDRNNMSPEIPPEKWVHRCSHCKELSVGYESILKLVNNSYTKLENRCKKCDLDRLDDYNFKKQKR